MANLSNVVLTSHAIREPHANSHNRSANGSTPRKPYVRVVTDKRREQNRRAQKAYRERMKKKLEELEEQAAASTVSLARLEDSTGPESISTNFSGEENEARLDGFQSALPQRTDTSSGGPQKVINLADAFVAAGDLPFVQGPLPSIQIQVGPDSPSPSATAENGVQDHIHEDYGGMDLHQIWPTAHSRHSSHTKRRRVNASKTLMTLTPQRTPTNGLFFPSPNFAVADPYVNHMRLVGEGNIEASLAVGLSIGISRTAYLNDHPSHFPGCYVALNTHTIDNLGSGLIKPVTVGYSFASQVMDITPKLFDHINSVKPPLRPTPTQLLNPHPSYLDCIVFPYFRDHAVQASVDGILDHGELFEDLMHGGLVCWGGASGLTNRHGKSVKVGKRDVRESVAWSTRSWEAKRWFLKKWTWLIGTEEEEEARGDFDGIWRGSRWWWDMRGEEDSDDEEDEQGEELTSLGVARVHELDVNGNCV